MNRTIINVVYAHLKPDFVSAMGRGDVLLVYTARPIIDCDMYVYWDAFSFPGRQKGINTLMLMEPSVVLPGQYNEDLWKHFDHVFTLYDAIIERYGFTKYVLTRQGFHPWFGESDDTAITEDIGERARRYPVGDRANAICLINGNKHSTVPGELYSKRIEAALWFSLHSDIPLDVFGFLPFFLPNYRGQIGNNKKLETLSRYKYSLYFENTGDPVLAQDYIDKILDPLEARSLPIYLGCPNIEDYIPESCFIDFRDFAGYEELDAYLRSLSDNEYLRYIENIDTWVAGGGLRPFSWSPLYDKFVRYYAERTGMDHDALVGHDTAWKPVPLTEKHNFIDAGPRWTFEELADMRSPLIDYENSAGGTEQMPDSERLAHAVGLAKKGFYREALQAMAYMHFYRNPDLFCFYAQLLRMCGFYDAESVQLAFALYLDANHAPTLKQKASPCTTEAEFLKAVSDFENILSNRTIASEATAGLVSVIVHISGDEKKAGSCIESLRANIEAPHELFVIPDSGHDTSAWPGKMIAGYPECTMIRHPGGTTYASACNAAIKNARGEYILIIGPDVHVLPGTIPALLECLDRDPMHGMAVPLANRAIGTQEIPGTGALSFDHFLSYVKEAAERNRHRVALTYECDSLCVLVKRTVLERAGLMKEYRTPYHVLNDLRMRALIEGYQSVVAADSYAYLDNDEPREKTTDGSFNMQWDTFNPNSETGRKLLSAVTVKNARDHYRKGSLDEAVQDIIDGIKFIPDEGPLYWCLADILSDAKLYEQADEALRSVPGTMKTTLDHLERYAACSYNRGRIDDARAYINQALSISARSTGAINLTGLIALQMSSQEKAEEFFRHAIALEPGFAEPYMNIGIMKWNRGEDNEALDYIERAFILSPETSDFSTTYYSAISSLNEFGRAEKIFGEAIGLYPRNKTLTFKYIGALLQQGKNRQAMEETEKAMITFGIDDGILGAALKVRDRLGSARADTNGRTGTLSVCMIVKDEEDRIARCLASLKPVADEIIIVDTGSTDRTKDIARAFGAQVFDFPWANDFSAARNYSMSRARGRWILVHDADEVISPRDYGKLRAILGSGALAPAAYSLITRNYSTDSVYEGWTANSGEYPEEEAGTGWFPSPKVRLVTNDPRFRFENPIHELLEPSLNKSGIEIRPCDVVIHHYGQANQERSQAKALMYYDIGRKKLEMEGDNEATLRELAIQARSLGKHEESIGLWKRYTAVNPGSYLPYFNMSGCYFELGQFEDSYRAALKAVELNPASKEAAQCYAAASLFRDDAGEAMRNLEGLLRKIPPYPTGKATLGAVYLASRMEEQGLHELFEMRQMSFDCSEMLYSLSRKLMSAGRTDTAVLLLEGMIKSGHGHPGCDTLLEECQTRPAHHA